MTDLVERAALQLRGAGRRRQWGLGVPL